jgi:hypothetical protein
MVTFSEISPSELRARYETGRSISEIATNIDKSYGFVRRALLSSGVAFRSKEQGARLYLEKHPEWSSQFVKYHVSENSAVTEDKIVLLTMIITEGYVDRTSLGFTNVQDSLHAEFGRLIAAVYGSVRVGRTGILSRISSTEIAKDIVGMMPEKSFDSRIFRDLIENEQTAAKVMRVIANTEGAMIIAVRKAPRNYTVESRIVLASTNERFRNQISRLLASLSIHSRSSPDGVIVNRKEDIRRFIQVVGFSPGVRVVRKKAGLSSWYGKEKYLLSKLSLRIYVEQERARKSGSRGCFVSCKTRGDLMGKLTEWYEEISGGERSTW